VVLAWMAEVAAFSHELDQLFVNHYNQAADSVPRISSAARWETYAHPGFQLSKMLHCFEIPRHKTDNDLFQPLHLNGEWIHNLGIALL